MRRRGQSCAAGRLCGRAHDRPGKAETTQDGANCRHSRHQAGRQHRHGVVLAAGVVFLIQLRPSVRYPTRCGGRARRCRTRRGPGRGGELRGRRGSVGHAPAQFDAAVVHPRRQSGKHGRGTAHRGDDRVERQGNSAQGRRVSWSCPEGHAGHRPSKGLYAGLDPLSGSPGSAGPHHGPDPHPHAQAVLAGEGRGGQGTQRGPVCQEPPCGCRFAGAGSAHRLVCGAGAAEQLRTAGGRRAGAVRGAHPQVHRLAGRAAQEGQPVRVRAVRQPGC